MKKILLLSFLMMYNYSTAQVVELQSMSDLTQQKLFSAGNVFIKDKTKKKIPSEIKGHPYLEKEFKKGHLLFENNKKYSALIRFDISEQKFEIKKDLNSPVTSIGIDKSVNVKIGEKIFKSHSFTLHNKSQNTIAILQEIKKTENYSLYIYPNKLIKIPEEKVSTAPGNVKEKVAQWKDDNKFIIIKNNVGYIIPKSHKKMSDLKLLKSDDYKKFRKKNKLNLKKRESLIKFVDYLNS
jgi:hypothetical protein